jgi:hypothetical protein
LELIYSCIRFVTIAIWNPHHVPTKTKLWHIKIMASHAKFCSKELLWSKVVSCWYTVNCMWKCVGESKLSGCRIWVFDSIFSEDSGLQGYDAVFLGVGTYIFKSSLLTSWLCYSKLTQWHSVISQQTVFVYAEISHLKLWHVAFRSFTIPALYCLTHSPHSNWKRQRIFRYGWEGLFETFFVKFWSALLDHLVNFSHLLASYT